METNYIPGQLRISTDNKNWTAEQWTGGHWILLKVEETREQLNKWLDSEWERYPVDNRATD